MSSSDLTVHHLKPPSSYVAANWPLQNAAMSPDGVDVAVAGRRGLALFSRRSSRWRLFGDVSHEKELAVHVGSAFRRGLSALPAKLGLLFG